MTKLSGNQGLAQQPGLVSEHRVDHRGQFIEAHDTVNDIREKVQRGPNADRPSDKRDRQRGRVQYPNACLSQDATTARPP